MTTRKLSSQALVLGLSLCAALAALPGCRARSEEGGPQPAAGAAAEPGIELLFTYGSEKQEWVDAVTSRFNAQGVRTAGGKVVRVEAVPQGSGEMIDDLLSGARKAHLASPASGLFLAIGNARSRAATGKALINETRNLVLSPAVIAMWRPMAEALGWGSRPVGWSDILDLARDPRGWAAHGHPEWGVFKLGHTHPETSNSGLAALLAEVATGVGKTAGLTLDDVRLPKTVQTVAGIESAIVHYGSSTGFFGKRLFADGPAYLSAAVLYENMVIESYDPKYRLPFPVVAVYPKEGTFWSDHPVGIVEREWVTPEHREAAGLYIDYLLARPQQEEAMRFGFRPAAVEVPLGAPVDAAHGVDPREPQTTLEVPRAEVIDAVLRLWHETKKRSDVTLVLDVSGSMQDEGKIDNAKAGAEQLLTLLDAEDRFSFLPFNAKATWAAEDLRLADARDRARSTLAGVFADGGTALYDAIAEAWQRARPRSGPGRITAIVVLSDGEDTDSRTTLPDLLRALNSGREGGGVRVFTIGYGRGAQSKVLEAIAEATHARSYKGTPENIRTVFREISTFF
jgi:Ca-activated chloride channel family protein